MSINRVQFQKGLSMAEFFERYGSEDQCHAALVALRWPDGFVCPDGGCTQHCQYRRASRTNEQCCVQPQSGQTNPSGQRSATSAAWH